MTATPIAEPDDAALRDVLGRAELAARAPLPERLAWLADAAAAIRAAGLGDDGARAALDLDAARGAFVAWTGGDRDARSLLELEALMQVLVTRALATSTAALARTWRAIAEQRGQRAAALEVARVLEDVSRSVAAGGGIPADATTRLAAARARLV